MKDAGFRLYISLAISSAAAGVATAICALLGWFASLPGFSRRSRQQPLVHLACDDAGTTNSRHDGTCQGRQRQRGWKRLLLVGIRWTVARHHYILERPVQREEQQRCDDTEQDVAQETGAEYPTPESD